MLLLKRRGKTEKGEFPFHLTQKDLCSVLSPAPVAMHNTSFSCKVNGVIMSVFLPLHYFYLQKSYCK